MIYYSCKNSYDITFIFLSFFGAFLIIAKQQRSEHYHVHTPTTHCQLFLFDFSRERAPKDTDTRGADSEIFASVCVCVYASVCCSEENEK